MAKIVFLIMMVFIYSSCKGDDKKVFPDEPQIYHQSTIPNMVNVFDSTAFTTIVFQFTDGDGDIGRDPQEEEMNIFLKDSRDTTQEDYSYSYPFPYIAPNIRPKGGLEGTVSVNLGRQYYPPRDSLHIALGKDTMFWSIYIMDNAGNKSNIIQSDTIFISF